MFSRVTKTLGGTLGVVRKLVTGYHPPLESKESKTVSSSTAAIIIQSSDKVETTAIDHFSRDIQSIITDFLDDTLKHQKRHACTSNIFLSNMVVIYAREIADHLASHIKILEALKRAEENPESLREVVETKDSYDQRVRGTPLQIMASLGERNPCKMKAGENYGFVELLRPCFSKIPGEYKRQLEEWPLDEKASDETMAPYYKAIDALCQEIIASTEISEDILFETLFLQFSKKFIEALKPNPDHVVKSGYVFDIGIFPKFFEIWEANIKALGGRGSLKSDLFAAIVYAVLHSRVPRIDLEVFNKGIGKVVSGHVPDRIDFSNGGPVADGLGSSFIFSFFGSQCQPSAYAVPCSLAGPGAQDAARSLFETYSKRKHQ